MESSQTYCFDDVAREAAVGETPILCAVCQDSFAAEELCDWLDTAVPAFSPDMTVERISADHLLDRVERAAAEISPLALIVVDATQVDDETLAARWHHWNLSREALRAGLLAPPEGTRRAVILVATAGPFRQVATQNHAGDLLSLTTVMTVDDTPAPIDPADKSLYEPFVAAARELEAKYSLSTQEFVRRLYEREPLPEEMPKEAIARWKEVAQRLRRSLPNV